MSETLIVCNACMHPVSSSERNAHYRGEWHRYNVKRQVAGLPPMSADVFASKLSALQAKQGQEAQDKAAHYCALCNKSCASNAAYLQHVNSKLHTKRVAKKDTHAQASKAETSQKKNRNPSEAESKQHDQAMEDDDDEADDHIPNLIDVEESRPKGIVYSNPTTRIVKVSKKQPEEEDDEDFEFDEKNAIPLMSCLFCSRSFSTIDKSLQHMLTAHGFFIPFSEHLVDMEALLKYLGAKVGAGRVCLWCNGTSFADVRAIRQHMIDKGHCKINLDDDEDEFAEYYNFPEDEGDDSELPIQDLNVANELVLASGAILGHREFRKLYRQNTRPESELEASDKAHRLLLGGAPHSGQLIASRAERQKSFSERQHYTKAFKNEVKSRLAHEYRANHQKHFVDSTGLY